jgi:hypothetical protein
MLKGYNNQNYIYHKMLNIIKNYKPGYIFTLAL